MKPVTSLIDPPNIISSDLESVNALEFQEYAEVQDTFSIEGLENTEAIDLPASPPASDKPTLRCELEIFTSTFITIFLAELGDKTQLTTLLMSAQSQSPWVVFAGASFALVLTSLLGVLLGRWLATKISPKTLEASAGVLLLIIAAMLCCDILWG